MARLVVMSDLVTRCKRRCDKEGDSSITDPEWKSVISELYAELYGLIAATGGRHFESTFTVTATGAASYTGPTDQLGFIGIDYLYDGTVTGRRRSLRPFEVQERNFYAGTTGDAVGYWFAGDQIYLAPRPSSGTYLVLYVPQPPDLSTYGDSTTVDLVVPDAEAFVVWGVATRMLAKYEMDPTMARAEREASRARVEEWALMRAINDPHHRTRARDDDPDDGWGGGWGGVPPWYR